MEGLLQFHPSNTELVTLKDEYVKESDINVLTLVGYRSDTELALSDRNWVFSRPIFPMIVLNSPLLVFLGYHTKSKYQPAQNTSISIVSTFRTIIATYSNNVFLDYFKANSERITSAVKSFSDRELNLLDHMNELVLQNPQMSQEDFVKHMTRYTFELINSMELCVYEMFALDIPKQHIYTPHTPNYTFTEELARVTEVMFLVKQQMSDHQLEREGFAKREYFGTFKCSLKNYLNVFNSQRVREYFNFLNLNDGRYD